MLVPERQVVSGVGRHGFNSGVFVKAIGRGGDMSWESTISRSRQINAAIKERLDGFSTPVAGKPQELSWPEPPRSLEAAGANRYLKP